MDFRGTGDRLSRADVDIAARLLEVSPAHIKAIVKVETKGSGFGPRGRPVILFEPHIFDRHLTRTPSKADEAEARRQQLSHPAWRAIPYVGGNDANYARLERAMAINAEAALMSCSWGLGQIMGFNFKAAGYASVRAMVEGMKAGEGEQLAAMCRFIKGNKSMWSALKRNDWAGFALRYNGKGYKANGYDTKLAYWYDRYAQDPENVAANDTQAGAGAGGALTFAGAAGGVDPMAEAMDQARELAWYIDAAKYALLALAILSAGVALWGFGRRLWKRWRGNSDAVNF